MFRNILFPSRHIYCFLFCFLVCFPVIIIIRAVFIFYRFETRELILFWKKNVSHRYDDTKRYPGCTRAMAERRCDVDLPWVDHLEGGRPFWKTLHRKKSTHRKGWTINLTRHSNYKGLIYHWLNFESCKYVWILWADFWWGKGIIYWFLFQVFEMELKFETAMPWTNLNVFVTLWFCVLASQYIYSIL